MKQYFVMVVILLSLLNGEANQASASQESNETVEPKRQELIDLDEEKKNSTRGDSKKEIIEGSLLLWDKDEVTFKGKILLEKAPVSVTYGDNDEVALIGDSISIDTMELKANSHIVMRDKDAKVFVDYVVRK